MKSHWSHVSAPFRTLTFRFHRTSGKCSDRGLNPTKAQPHLHSSNHTSTGSSLCAGRLAGSGRCLETLSVCLCLHRGDQHQRAACPLTWPRWGPASSGSVHVAWCCLCASQGSPASGVPGLSGHSDRAGWAWTDGSLSSVLLSPWAGCPLTFLLSCRKTSVWLRSKRSVHMIISCVNRRCRFQAFLGRT